MTWRSADRVVERKTVAVRPPHAFSEEVMSLASGVGVCIVFQRPGAWEWLFHIWKYYIDLHQCEG